MIFRDQVISDKIGFTYSGLPGEAAADRRDERLDNIQAHLRLPAPTDSHLVSIILDGENAGNTMTMMARHSSMRSIGN